MAKKVLVVGAGPGGLSAAMLLAHRGFDVELFERHSEVGGRNRHLQVGDYRFDVGPTFLMFPQILEALFTDSGRDLANYLDLRRIDPIYRLSFADGTTFEPTGNRQAMLAEIERAFPGDSAGYTRFMQREGRKLEALYPCLQMPYAKPTDFLRPNFIRALPLVDPVKSIHQRLSTYFRHEHLRIAMTFQAKYLGMSPWDCPATFAIIPFIEHRWGIFHPIGGLNTISKAMAAVVAEDDGKLHLNTAVKRVLVENRRAVGLELADGERRVADYVVLNADFAHAMTHLVDARDRRKWTDAALRRREYSCSTFMLYLGLDCRYEDVRHHNIFVAEDYRTSVQTITSEKLVPDDLSIYVQNASVTDATLAPPGHSTLYVLVPVPNLAGPVDWSVAGQRVRDRVMAMLRARPEFPDLERHIVVERTYTPADWQQHENVYLGAVFNLSHKIRQMLLWRPHNRFEEFDRCYLVGGGTHPGSGLPTIYESGRIAADLITAEELAVPFKSISKRTPLRIELAEG